MVMGAPGSSWLILASSPRNVRSAKRSGPAARKGRYVRRKDATKWYAIIASFMYQVEPELISGVAKHPKSGKWQTWYALGRYGHRDFVILGYSAYKTKNEAQQEIDDLYRAV